MASVNIRPYVSGPSKDWIKDKCPEWRETNQWRHEFFARQNSFAK